MSFIWRVTRNRDSLKTQQTRLMWWALKQRIDWSVMDVTNRDCASSLLLRSPTLGRNGCSVILDYQWRPNFDRIMISIKFNSFHNLIPKMLIWIQIKYFRTIYWKEWNSVNFDFVSLYTSVYDWQMFRLYLNNLLEGDNVLFRRCPLSTNLIMELFKLYWIPRVPLWKGLYINKKLDWPWDISHCEHQH